LAGRCRDVTITFKIGDYLALPGNVSLAFDYVPFGLSQVMFQPGAVHAD
jgi:hypothetical protein